MSNLIEVVFENVGKNCVLQLLKLLITSLENIISIECTENPSLFKEGQLSEEGINPFLDFEDDVTVLIKIRSIDLGSIILPNVQLRLLKYEGQYDIEFNFDSNELENTTTTTLVKELHAYAKRIAIECGISDFCCGMEPASDEDTRYFTNDELGPLAA